MKKKKYKKKSKIIKLKNRPKKKFKSKKKPKINSRIKRRKKNKINKNISLKRDRSNSLILKFVRLQKKFKSIAVEKIPNISFGVAINDRLIRASKF